MHAFNIRNHPEVQMLPGSHERQLRAKFFFCIASTMITDVDTLYRTALAYSKMDVKEDELFRELCKCDQTKIDAAISQIATFDDVNRRFSALMGRVKAHIKAD